MQKASTYQHAATFILYQTETCDEIERATREGTVSSPEHIRLLKAQKKAAQRQAECSHRVIGGQGGLKRREPCVLAKSLREKWVAACSSDIDAGKPCAICYAR